LEVLYNRKEKKAISREVFNDEITEHLATLLELKLDELSKRWYEESNENGEASKVVVYKDLQAQIGKTPAIEIVEKGSDCTQISVGAQHETFNYDILVSVSANHTENGKRFLKIIASSVREILNLYENRSFVVPKQKFRVYESFAENVEFGYRRGQGFQSARIGWYAKLFKPDKQAC
jgi:hypothetical protein